MRWCRSRTSPWRSSSRVVSFLAIALAGLGASSAEAQSGGTISGQVLNSDGAPAVGAEVRIVSLARLARVGEEGTFSFEGVPSGH